MAVVQIKIGSLGLSTDAASAAFILDFIGMTKNEDFTVKRQNKGRFLSALFGKTVPYFGDFFLLQQYSREYTLFVNNY